MIAHVVLPAFALLIFLAFLVLLATLGRFAASATRGARDVPRGCLGSLGMIAVLLFLCALGAAGFVAFLIATAGATAIEHNPVRSVEVIRTAPGAAERPMSLVFDVEGDARGLLDHLESRLGRRALDDVRILRRADGGAEVEVRLPVGEGAVEELRLELERWDWELPGGVKVELRGDWARER